MVALPTLIEKTPDNKSVEGYTLALPASVPILE